MSQLPEFDAPLYDGGWNTFGERYEAFQIEQAKDQQRLRKLAADAAAGVLPDDADPDNPEIVAVTSVEQRFAMADAPKRKAQS